MKTIRLKSRKGFRAAPLQTEVRWISKGDEFDATEAFAAANEKLGNVKRVVPTAALAAQAVKPSEAKAVTEASLAKPGTALAKLKD